MSDVLHTLTTEAGSYRYYDLNKLAHNESVSLSRLPFAIRILLEGALRNAGHSPDAAAAVLPLLNWQPHDQKRGTVPFFPGRVIMQDFTGIPVINDLAAMRATMARLGADPEEINPVIPVDVIIDHSLQVDVAGCPEALERNMEIEFQRNMERYQFLHWGQRAFSNLRVLPPGLGIIHQINIEHLAQVVLTRHIDDVSYVYPDTVVGTDSHTTMVNGLGVAGWGVGGIEAVAAMMGESLDMVIPDVIGIRIIGKLRDGVTPTDLTLTFVEKLRQRKVVGKFVEFFGTGVLELSLADRALIANMTPENGATMTFFPVDTRTLDYLRLTGRPETLIKLTEAYYRAQGLFRTDETPDPLYSDVLTLDLGSIEPSLAGPRRPQDRIALSAMRSEFHSALNQPKAAGGFGIEKDRNNHIEEFELQGQKMILGHGAVVIASITSCTNTSNPFVMLAAGLLARKAVARGLKVPSYVKTSLAPGSQVVTGYLQKAKLIDALAELGFDVVGYGCATCIGNTGPLAENVVQAINQGKLATAAVISGNRNFEGRISPYTLANYLASPPLVVAYALAGTVNINFESDPIGLDDKGSPVYLRDIWPSTIEIEQAIKSAVNPDIFRGRYHDIDNQNPLWSVIESGSEPLYTWRTDSTYLQEPPFFAGMTKQPEGIRDIVQARVLAVLGDSTTTDHISPAGSIQPDSPAGEYLQANGVEVLDFNSFGSRRGNDRVMTRATFGNIRLKNLLLPGVEGGYSRVIPGGEQISIYAAAQIYAAENIPLVVIAGKEYGTGSSRDWAAKGTLLLGVRAVFAESYERIHRSNLIGMGVLPLQFLSGENLKTLGLTGEERFSIYGLDANLNPGGTITVSAENDNGIQVEFNLLLRIDTAREIEVFRNGGIMQTILYRQLNIPGLRK